MDGLGLVCARRRTRRFYTAKPYNEGAKWFAGLRGPARKSAGETMGRGGCRWGRDRYFGLRLMWDVRECNLK